MTLAMEQWNRGPDQSIRPLTVRNGTIMIFGSRRLSICIAGSGNLVCINRNIVGDQSLPSLDAIRVG
jgi:hypothetical protein